MGCAQGMFVFCPLETNPLGEYVVVTGLNFVSESVPDGYELAGVISHKGDVEYERFCRIYEKQITLLRMQST